MNRLMKTLVVPAVMGLSLSAWAQQQQAADSAPADTDLAADVQQLKAEVERLSREMERISAQMERLQGEHASREKPAARETKPPAGKPAPTGATKATAAAPSAAEPEEPAPLTVLVFKDGHRVECRNYAIVGQTLWVYTEQDSKKYPLSELNVEETRRANSDRGLAFQLPPAP